MPLGPCRRDCRRMVVSGTAATEKLRWRLPFVLRWSDRRPVGRRIRHWRVSMPAWRAWSLAHACARLGPGRGRCGAAVVASRCTGARARGRGRDREPARGGGWLRPRGARRPGGGDALGRDDAHEDRRDAASRAAPRDGRLGVARRTLASAAARRRGAPGVGRDDGLGLTRRR